MDEFKLSMGRLKWFDRFLTNEIVAQNRFLSRRRRKNKFLRPLKEMTSTMGLSPISCIYPVSIFVYDSPPTPPTQD